MNKITEIILRNVTIDYPIYSSGPKFLSKKILSLATAGIIGSSQSHNYVRSLDGIHLHLSSGDRLAVIGGNGAGKTTLLKVLAGIYFPSNGERIVNGTVTTLLGTGFGLDEDSTGYENIILGGIALGQTAETMTNKISEIEAFTELGEFLSLPFRTYSAGMRARLAFAIATAVYPDILIIDEGLGVGDQAFFNKANKRVEDFSQKAKILVIASHDTSVLKKFCNKAIVLHHGKLQFQGTLEDSLQFYAANIVG